MENLSYAVVMHIYNEEETLEKVLDAILKQSINPETIYVVDDGSTDNTNNILHKKKIKHIHLIQDTKLPTPIRRANAFNKAISDIKTDAPFLLKVDGDTVIEENYAETLIKIMDNPLVAASSGISINYFKTRDLNNGAVLYRKNVLPYAKTKRAWDRGIQLDLTRKGFIIYVTTETSYNDLRMPNTVKPPLSIVLKNRIDKKIAEIHGSVRRNYKNADRKN